jgi:hypothetical protein
VIAIAWFNRFFDEYVINFSFDRLCGRMKSGGWVLSAPRTGQVQSYLRVVAFGAATIALLLLLWGCRPE